MTVVERVFQLRSARGAAVAVMIAFASILTVSAQSGEIEYPAPVTGSTVSGTIRARDIGDSRLTTHYWAFEGTQGDIFINVATQNFSGDIDVYSADGLRPLVKMVIVADAGTTETGRVIYMRQAGRLLLRIQGRSPNDDPATYRVKFAGSFVALAPGKLPKPPTVGDLSDHGASVSATGAALPAKPKPKQTPSPVPAAKATTSASASTPAKRADNEERPEQPARSPGRPGVDTIFGGRNTPPVANPPVRSSSQANAKPKKEPEPDPLVNVRLVVSFKDGHMVERPMNEVARFIYANGYLTVALKDGKTYRYALADLSSVNVQ